MSKSHKYDPDDPDGAYRRKVSANNHRRVRQGVNHDKLSRQAEFAAGAALDDTEVSRDVLDVSTQHLRQFALTQKVIHVPSNT